MDWVQVYTIVLALLLVSAVCQRSLTKPEGSLSMIIFLAIVFVPFGRVLKLF